MNSNYNIVDQIDLRRISPEFEELVGCALRSWNATAFSVRQLLSGKSGAHIILVDVVLPDYNGVAVIKFGPLDLLRTEIANHEIARKLPKLISDSVPLIINRFDMSSEAVFLMSVAGWSLLEVSPMASLQISELNFTCQLISQKLLADWNPNPRFSPTPQALTAVLDDWIKRQIGPDSRISSFIEAYTNIRSSNLFFRYAGTDYPNPLAVARGDGTFKIDFHPAVGVGHGDLHQGNVLVSRFGEQKKLFIIDFETFSTSTPVLFDHSYLELNLLLTARSSVTASRWKAICDALASINEPRDSAVASYQDDQGILWTCGMLRSPITKWMAGRVAPRTEDVKKQLYASRIAAGLNFCNKRSLDDDLDLSNKKKFFAFLYAAAAARQLLQYCRIDISSDAPVMRVKSELPIPSSDSWRAGWTACAAFDEGKSAFILICASEMEGQSEFTIRTISRLPWKVVINLSEKGVNSKFATIGLPEVLKRQAVFHVYPHQVGRPNLNGANVWVATENDESSLTNARDTISGWKKRSLAPIRDLASILFHHVAPMPITAVVTATKMQSVKLRAVFSALQESIGSTIEVVVFAPDSEDGAAHDLQGDAEKLREIPCSLDDFALGVHQMIGDSTAANSIMIPVRGEARSARQLPLKPEEFAYYSANFEIFPASLSSLSQVRDPLAADFLQGGLISWHDLDCHLDVDRDVTRQAVGKLRARLSASPNESFAIEHSPGAGGTTLSRRMAWELRDEFPCVVIAGYSSEHVDALESLFQKASLPLLIIVEAGKVTASHRDSLFAELKARNVRFVILDVKRRLLPSEGDHSVSLADPISLQEARRFLSVYTARSPQSRHNLLKALASDQPQDLVHAQYRSPFFFGLYAFEREFLKVDDFVLNMLEGVPELTRTRLCFLALTTRYSQERFPIPALSVLLGMSAVATRTELEKAVGEGPSRLILFEGQTIGMRHPLLAEVVLKHFLQPKRNDNVEAWRGPLAEFCIAFIDEIARCELGNNDRVLEILYDLFLERQTTYGIAKKNIFSELLEELSSFQSERIVLERLCHHFPENAHFMSHLARNINYRRTGTFEEARDLAEKAIALDDKDDDHHHVLGMVYRFEIERRLEIDRRHLVDLKNVLASIDDIFGRAQSSFRKSAELRPDNQFPLITPIQMTLHTLEKLFSLSGEGNFIEFISSNASVGGWARQKLDYASDLFDALHRLEANGQPTERRVKCDADFSRLLGDFEAMVDRLRSLLARPEVAKAPVRRLLSSSYLEKLRREPVDNVKMYRGVAALADENLKENPASIADLRNWIRAYRVLPDFSFSVAIDKFSRASLISEDPDPLYYLMILHFLAAKSGVRGGLIEAKRYADLCKKRSERMSSKQSFEWISNEKLGRPLPLVHHSELGKWSKENDFFLGAEKLGPVIGRIDEIKSPQAGTIISDGMPAFFVPRSDFRKMADTNTSVRTFIGFSYEGLRAWNIRRATRAEI